MDPLLHIYGLFGPNYTFIVHGGKVIIISNLINDSITEENNDSIPLLSAFFASYGVPSMIVA